MTISVPFNMFQSSAMRKGLVYDPYKKCMSYGVKILNSDYKRQNGSSCIRNFIKCCEVVRNSAKKKEKTPELNCKFSINILISARNNDVYQSLNVYSHNCYRPVAMVLEFSDNSSHLCSTNLCSVECMDISLSALYGSQAQLYILQLALTLTSTVNMYLYLAPILCLSAEYVQ